MSSSYQPKRKELAKVKAVSSDTYSKNRKNFKFVGFDKSVFESVTPLFYKDIQKKKSRQLRSILKKKE